MTLATLNNVTILNDVKGKINNTAQCMGITQMLYLLLGNVLNVSSLQQPHRGRRSRVYKREVFVAHKKSNNSMGSEPSSGWQQLHSHEKCRKCHIFGSLLIWPHTCTLPNTVKLIKN
jgi:hypothetical protein